MKAWTSFDLKPSFFSTSINPISNQATNNLKPCSVQDTIHIGTKFRNRMLNSSIVLHIGTKIVSTVHIKTLLKIVKKEVHGLVPSDIIPEDRQNYSSLEKVMNDRVLKAMGKHVPDSEGTIMYLTLCKLITSSFLSTNVKPIERIYNIWYAVYFLRCWWKWIKANKDYSLDDNFISNNAYTCVEINAQGLIEIIIKLRSKGQDNLFLPHLYASQPREHIFRMMRSMGTINYTKINFTLNELLHMIARVGIMNKTICNHNDIDFPRISKDKPPELDYKLPSDCEIQKAMVDAQKNALEKVAQFGIFCTPSEIENTEMTLPKNRIESIFENELDSELDSESCQSLEGNSPEIPSSFLHLIGHDGTTRPIRKSTFIWMHSENKDKLSSDRLKRVQGSSFSLPNAKRKKQSNAMSNVSDPNLKETILDPILIKSDEIMIGDWVIFDLKNETTSEKFSDKSVKQNSYLNGHIIGLVTGFRYKTVNNRSLQYKSQFVSLLKSFHEEKNLLVLAIWYSSNENGLLNQITGNFTVDIDSYKYTMKSPIIKTESGSANYTLPFQCSEFKFFL